MNSDEATIFSSAGSMSSAERDAIKSGEKRGEKMAMAERPEHYGNIGSRNNKLYRENYDKIDWSDK